MKVIFSVFYYRNISENIIFWPTLKLPTGVKMQHKKMYVVEESIFITGNIHNFLIKSCDLNWNIGLQWEMLFKWWLIIFHVMVGFFPFYSAILFCLCYLFKCSRKCDGSFNRLTLAFLFVNILRPIQIDNIEQNFLF